MVQGYSTSMNLPQVDGLSMDPRILGRHIDTISKYSNILKYYKLFEILLLIYVVPYCAIFLIFKIFDISIL